jgi:hypothetical protein
MATNVEKQLSHRLKRKGTVVPLLEDLMTRALRIETNGDVEFIRMMVNRQMRREEMRSLKGHYSPSALASCLRQVYFSRHWREHEIKRKITTRVEPNFYFLTGEWLHLKWQYALRKLDQALPDEEFFLWGVELPVESKHKDHGGTLDALVAVKGEYTILDFKGVNVRTFSDALVGNFPHRWGVQLADYIMLANADKTLKIPRIEKGILIFENKGGPTPGNPIALHEIEIQLKDYLPEIQFRLKELRAHEKGHTVPDPECASTKSIQFQDCPFRGYCKPEVKVIEGRNATERKVEISTRRRTDRPRRNKSRR